MAAKPFLKWLMISVSCLSSSSPSFWLSRIPFEELLFGSPHVVQQLGFEAPDVFDGHRVQVTAGAQEDRNHLLLNRHGLILRLLEQLDQPLTTLQLRLGRGVQVRSEGGERFQFAVLRQVQAQTIRPPLSWP